MTEAPQKTQFSFVANSAELGDSSGVATWVVPKSVGGEWVTETISLEFKSFADAMRVNDALLLSWEAGRAKGYADCEAKVLEALGS